MESAAIIDWLEDTYPDRPSVYLPEAEPPIDLASPAYKKARVDDGVEELTEWLSPYKPSLMRICKLVWGECGRAGRVANGADGWRFARGLQTRRRSWRLTRKRIRSTGRVTREWARRTNTRRSVHRTKVRLPMSSRPLVGHLLTRFPPRTVLLMQRPASRPSTTTSPP